MNAQTPVRIGQLFFRHQIDYITSEYVVKEWETFDKYQDKNWSFTNCISKVVMERLGIKEAFAFDRHFEQFGTISRVP